MKILFFALVLVVAGAYAKSAPSNVVVVDSPNQAAPINNVDDLIRQIIKFISDGIKKIGLDPVEIQKKEFVFPSKPSVVKVKGHLENLKYDGASNIQINSLDYKADKLVFNISLPQISLNIGDSGIEVSVFNHKLNSQLKGSLITQSIGLSGEASVSVTSNVINHTHLNSISLNFDVGSIKSELSVSALGFDFSKSLNKLFNEIVPHALKKHEAAINKLLEGVIKAVFFFINLIF